MNRKLPNQRTFDEGIQGGWQNITLLGMSGIGKSKWRERIGVLERFTPVEIDAEIGRSEEMARMIAGVPGADEAEKMGNLFGNPWEDPSGYRMQERRYLDIEAKRMQALASDMRHARIGQAFVADLTGSAIYCRSELNGVLDKSLGVLLATSPEKEREMLDTFLKDPKPICWGSLLEQWSEAFKRDNETAENMLPELYGALLQTRQRLYDTFADVTIPWEEHRDPKDGKLTTDDLFGSIRKRLPTDIV